MIPTPNIQNWSYGHDPANSDLDAVRFYIGDTNKDDKLLDDNEILFALSEEGNVRQASISCLQNLITIYSRFVDSSKDKGGAKALSQRVTSFEIALATLLEKQSMSGLQVFAGGLSISGKESQEADTDRVSPVFTKDMFNNPRAARPDPDDRT